MFPAKAEPIPIPAIREEGPEFIFDWFNQHKQSLYAVGCLYLRSQQQLEDLFCRSILKAQKELPRFNGDTSFEMWVTSLFLNMCRELSDDRSIQALKKIDPRQDVYKALDQLKALEKEAIVLTYVMGFSREEAAHLLHVSVEKLKESLFSGIQSLRKGMGYSSPFYGCKEYQKDYIDYLDRTIERSKKVDFEIHLYHCQNCQEDLAALQVVMLNITERMKDLHVPSGFMENVKTRLAEVEKHKQWKYKKRKRVGFILASVFILLMGIGFLTGLFTNIYYAWTEDDQGLRTFLQEGLGERLNLEAESNGVKIKIKSVVADDIQTLIFYEIEDTKEKNQYMMNYGDGVFVEHELETMRHGTYPLYYPPDLESDINNKEKNVYHGKISLFPLRKDNGTIKLKITKLQKLIRDPININDFEAYGNIEPKTGEWNFEIPVTKKPSIEYSLHKKTEVEGIPIRFEKLIIAPTTTALQFGISTIQSKKRINTLTFDNLEVNHKKVKTNIYGNTFLNSSSQENKNWITFQTYFNPLFGEKPKEVNAQFGSVFLSIEDPKTIELDDSKEYPRTFEYAGSTISIDKVKVGDEVRVVINDNEIKNRKYDSLIFRVVGDEGNETMNIISKDVFVDKNGVEYNTFVPYKKIGQLRHFTKVKSIVLSNNAGEKLVPKRLEIDGYVATKYLDNVVKLKLGKKRQVPRSGYN